MAFARPRCSSGSSARSRFRRQARASCASRSSARRSCARSTQRLPPSGPILQALARFDPFPQIDGPRPNVRPPDSRDRPRSRGARGGAAWSRCSAPRAASGAGQRLGRRRRRGRDQRPRRRGPGRHDRADRAVRATARRRGDLVRPAQRPRRPAGARGVGRAGAAAQRGRPPGHLRRRSSASPRTGPTTSGPAVWGQTRDGGHPGRLRPRPGAAVDHLAAGLVRSGNSGGPWSTAGGRVVTTIFAARSPTAARAASACPGRSCATRSIGPTSRWTPVPARVSPRRAPRAGDQVEQLEDAAPGSPGGSLHGARAQLGHRYK